MTSLVREDNNFRISVTNTVLLRDCQEVFESNFKKFQASFVLTLRHC